MRKVKGFTLSDLLVVVAVIAVLMAILMPALQGVLAQGKDEGRLRFGSWTLFYDEERW